jgi:hypothetical protein
MKTGSTWDDISNLNLFKEIKYNGAYPDDVINILKINLLITINNKIIFTRFNVFGIK